METKKWLRENGLYVGAAVTLVVGMVAASVIYVTAEDAQDLPLDYDPENSKKYLRALETYGGKANVMASEFMSWFHRLWHGKRLAFTLAVISIVVSLLLLYLDRLLDTRRDDDTSSGPGRR